MLNPHAWMVAAVALWIVAFLTAVVGYVVATDALVAFSFLLRRIALLATLIWLIFTAVAAGWHFIRRR